MTDTIDPTIARQVLDLPMSVNDADAATIRDYLIELLAKVWDEGECFNGKRPFGNSGWEDELYPPLVTAGMVPGRVDEDGYGYVTSTEEPAARALIAAAIRELR